MRFTAPGRCLLTALDSVLLLLKQFASDNNLLYLAGSFIDGEYPAVPEHTLNLVVLDKAVAAMNLDCLLGNFVTYL